MLIRPIRPDDKGRILDAFDRLGPESRYRRFLSPLSELDPAQLRYLTEVDHHDHEALIALEEGSGRGLGVARFVRPEPAAERAEVAVAVVDDWQQRGLGTCLFKALLERAREEDVRAFTGLVLEANEGLLERLAAVGEVSVLTKRSGVIELLVDVSDEGVPQAARHTFRAAAKGEASPAPFNWRRGIEFLWRSARR